MTDPLLAVEDLVATFPLHGGRFGRSARRIQAVSGLSISVGAGETVALVGESGSGKSTVARTIIGLHAADAGSVVLDGLPVDPRSKKRPGRFRAAIQFVFQDPYACLDPRMRVADQVIEPLVIAGRVSRSERAAVAADLLRAVGMPADAGRRLPYQFSGGQRQRLAIARALAIRPRLVICDGPTTALDVSVQAQVLDLLRELQAEWDVAYVPISHDLAVVRAVARRVMVMYLGHVVESADTAMLFARARHPYTQALVPAARIRCRRSSAGGGGSSSKGRYPAPPIRPSAVGSGPAVSTPFLAVPPTRVPQPTLTRVSMGMLPPGSPSRRAEAGG